jgi:hypothetical protein
MNDPNWSIVDILLGRHQHQPMMKITVDHRIDHNYRLHEPSRCVEMANGGRQRNSTLFDDPANDIAQSVTPR